jgi:hypothetical protein
LAIPAGAFDQVLAEAEAALSHDPQHGVTAPDSATPPTPQPAAIAQEDVAADEAVVPPGDEGGRGESAIVPKAQQTPDAGEPESTAKVTPPERTALPKARPETRTARPAPVAQPTRPARPSRIPDLGPGLRRLGVPPSYLPPGRRPSLDALAGIMATLPVPPALPSREGAVVAVVGVGEDLARTVKLVTAELALGSRDVLPFDGSADSSEKARLDRQIARRRASGNGAVMAVEFGPGPSLHSEVPRLLRHATPDYVLAAVGAGCKRVDVEHWIGELRTVDALALWDLSGTRTPAELLGVCPIAFVQGEASSTLGWTLLLAGRAAEPRP